MYKQLYRVTRPYIVNFTITACHVDHGRSETVFGVTYSSFFLRDKYMTTQTIITMTMINPAAMTVATANNKKKHLKKKYVKKKHTMNLQQF